MTLNHQKDTQLVVQGVNHVSNFSLWAKMTANFDISTMFDAILKSALFNDVCQREKIGWYLCYK
jgi:hypothetical protein